MLRETWGVDPETKVQRERMRAELYKAYVVVAQLGALDAAGVDQFVDRLLADGAVEHLDAVLEHLEVAAGAWRELAGQADRVIESVGAALTRTVLERAAAVDGRA